MSHKSEPFDKNDLYDTFDHVCSCGSDCECEKGDEHNEESCPPVNDGSSGIILENVPVATFVNTATRSDLVNVIRSLYNSDNIESILRYASIDELKEIFIERSSKLSLSEILSVAEPEDVGEWLAQFGIVDEDGFLTESYRKGVSTANDEIFLNLEEDNEPCCPVVKHKCAVIKIALCAALFIGIKRVLRKS